MGAEKYQCPKGIGSRTPPQMEMPGASPVTQMVKQTNKPAFNAGDTKSIPGSGNPLEKGMATNSSMLAWRIPWTEVPGRLQYWGGKESDMTEGLQFLFFLSSPLHKMLSYLHVTYTDSPLQFKLSADYLYLA